MLPRPKLRPAFRRQLFRQHASVSRRTLIAAPKEGGTPLLTRRSDRALPSLSSGHRWWHTMPIFIVVMIVSALGIFNYQKQCSSVVTSTLYALRTNADARKVLGDEIYFASRFPWIWGEMNQWHGRINIEFWVKGTRGMGLMKFHSERRTRMGFFHTLEWTLKTEDGEVISLLLPESRDSPVQQTADKASLEA